MPLLTRPGSKEKTVDTHHPSPRSPIAEFIWDRMRDKHNFEPLSEQSLQNLARANEHLKQGALVVYLNHTSTNDAPVAISLVLSHLTNARRFMGPAGMKHYDLSRDPKNAVLLRALRLLNIHAMPVVQHDDLEHYPPEKRERLLTNLKRKAQNLLSKPGSIYGITPEGTRNRETGTLLRARPGIGKLQKYSHNLTYLPIAITYAQHSEQPQVVIGAPERLGDLVNVFDVMLPQEENERAQAIADLLMYNLSLLMPESLRGVYTNFEI